MRNLTLIIILSLGSFLLKAQTQKSNVYKNDIIMYLDISAGLAVPEGALFSVGTHLKFPMDFGISLSYFGSKTIENRRKSNAKSFFGGYAENRDENKLSAWSARLCKEFNSEMENMKIGMEAGISRVQYNGKKIYHKQGFWGAESYSNSKFHSGIGFSGKALLKFKMTNSTVLDLYSQVELNKFSPTVGVGVGFSFKL